MEIRTVDQKAPGATLMSDYSETTHRHLEAAIQRSETRTRHLKSLRDANVKRTSILCKFCKNKSHIRSVIYIQTHWYVRPYGCTEGDYWKSGEGNWDCLVCGRRNRLFDKPEIVAMKRLFASVRECYCADFSSCSDPNPCKECKAAGATKYGMPDTRRVTATV